MKFLKLNKITYSALLLLSSLHSKAQKTEIRTNNIAAFHHAVELYNSKAYATAQQEFEKITVKTKGHKTLQSDANYYDAMCAIKLSQANADQKVLDFVANHPYSNKKEKAYLNVGNHYFSNRKAAHALKWYQRVNPDFLNQYDKDELNYKMGYALLVSNYVKDAKKKFATLLGNPLYGNDARYYYGYISYKEENFGEAEDNLSKLADNATYKSKANYYLLDMSFKGGKFEKSIQIGEKILATADKKEHSNIAKIIGESYFNLSRYREAIPYLTAYKGKNGKWKNTDYYYLGYAYYKQKDYVNAVKNFNKIIGAENLVAQNAYYHLGECYLKLDKKPEALNAFKNASEMGFEPKINEGATLNYAKLSYEEGNPYETVPNVLKSFLTKYPSSTNAPEIKNLLITSYLYQKDFQGALDYLAKNKSPENNTLANEISLYRGIQLFNEEHYKKANPHFLIAADSQDKSIKDKAMYWMAESDYLLGEYENAIDEFLAVKNNTIAEAKHINYNIGYSYFKLKKYGKAATFFKKFLEQQSDDIDTNNDALHRLGDSYYASKDYTNATKIYKKIISEGRTGADYAQYQKAMSNGFLGNNQEKIKDLLAIVSNYPSSKLQDDALFQLASTYTATGKTSKAHGIYNKLITKHPKSSYVPSALLRDGLLFYNNNNNLKALSKYKEVVAKYPNSNEAKQAVTNAKKVYVDIGKVNEYATWVKNIDFVNVSNADLDNATYESAENKFLDNNVTKAITGFTGYLKNFPNGLHVLQAHFYLGKLYINNKQPNKALTHYNYVVSKGKNDFSEEALAKLAQLYLEKENWTSAIPILQRLETEANNNKNTLFAQSNLMKGLYEKKQYAEAVKYAEKVLSNPKIASDVDSDAKIIIARCAIQTKDFETAEEYYIIVSETATGKLKAESLYYQALFAHERKEYAESNTIVQDLIANYATYKYWGVKSYIIMAKNYYELKDAYQATYILKNIIKNFTQYKDLIEEATNELRTIQNKEAKTNASVNPRN